MGESSLIIAPEIALIAKSGSFFPNPSSSSYVTCPAPHTLRPSPFSSPFSSSSSSSSRVRAQPSAQRDAPEGTTLMRSVRERESARARERKSDARASETRASERSRLASRHNKKQHRCARQEGEHGEGLSGMRTKVPSPCSSKR
eukprot:3922497-Rhodomonas_salina.1